MPHGAIRFPFGECRVCSDKATGVHYGVATCEGCKGFFKRSLPKYDKYRCFNDGNCTFDRSDRNRCKSCRFQRCLNVGMSLEGVKMGRIPKVDKEKALEEEQRRLSNTEQSGSDSMNPVASQYPACTNSWNAMTSCRPVYASAPLSTSLPSRVETPFLRNTTQGHIRFPAPTGNEHTFHNNTGSSSFTARVDNEVVRPLYYQDAYRTHDHQQLFNDLRHREQQSARVLSLSSSSLDQAMHDDYVEFGRRSPNGFHQVSGGNHSFQFNSQRGGGDAFSTARRSSNVDDNLLHGSTQKVSLSKISSASELTSQSSGSVSPYSPMVIKELIDQVIQLGHTKELQQHVAHEFLTSVANSCSQTQTSSTRSTHCSLQHNGNERLQYSRRSYDDRLFVDEVNQSQDRCMTHFAPGRMEHLEPHSSVEGSGGVTVGLDLSDKARRRSSLDLSAKELHPQMDTWPNDEVREKSTHDRECVYNDRGVFESGCHESMELDGTYVHIEKSNSSDELSYKLSSYDFNPIIPLPDLTKIPKLKFWHVGLADLESEGSVDDNEKSSLSADRLKETESVLAWLEDATQVFVESIFMSKLLCDEEEKGLRPIHKYNKPEGTASQENVRAFWNDIIKSIPSSNSYILGLCSSIPGFGELCQQDRAILMEAAYFELWLIQWSQLFGADDSYFRMVTGARYSKAWMQMFLPESLVGAMYHFTKELNMCQLTPTEIIILSAIQLTNASCKGLNDVTAVQRLHDYYLDLLAYVIERNHAATHSRILIKIFQLLPLLGPINAESVCVMNLNVSTPPAGDDSLSENEQENLEDSLSE